MKMLVQQGRKGRRKTNQRILLPDPATESRDDQGFGLRTVRVKSDIRFPCIHKNGPVYFQ